MKAARFIFAILTLALFAAGCRMGPDYKRPDVTAPEKFRSDLSNKTNSLGDMPWWELFRDPALQDLIHTALTNSYDLRIAVSRVDQAQAVLEQNRSQYFPQITYAGAVGVGHNSLQGNAVAGLGQSEWFEAVGNVSWEVDLWGRIRRLNESARAQFLATKEARTNVMITVISMVASDYFQLLALDQELKIARDTTNSFGQSLKLFQAQLKGGVASKLETSAAEAEEASAAATVPDLERQIVIEENQIHILLGLPPGPVHRGKKLLEEMLPPDVPPGLPSALLERRPDIMEAEQMVRSANAQIGVAKADFFPRLDLTALAGQVSSQLTAFTTTGANAWSLAANLGGPIFEGGLLKGQLHQAQAAWRETVLQYQYAVLTALQEVSNQLIAREKLASVREQQDRAVKAYQVAVDVATQRYKAGQSSYYEILQEQQLLFPAQNSLTQTEVNQLLAIVQLYQALGGGWHVRQQTAH
jgi:multidrug efflux system outer membrane protein